MQQITELLIIDIIDEWLEQIKMNAENERMFQENIVILNENFFRYLENSLRDMPSADYVSFGT